MAINSISSPMLMNKHIVNEAATMKIVANNNASNNARARIPTPIAGSGIAIGGPIKAPVLDNPMLPRPPEHGGPIRVDQTI